MFPPEVYAHIFREIRGLRPSGPYTSACMDDMKQIQYAGGDDSGLPTLLQVCLTCKAFNELATPMLYQTFHQKRSYERQKGFLDSVRRRPALGQHIKRVLITLIHSDSTILNLFKMCTRVEQLVLNRPGRSKCGVRRPAELIPQDYQNAFESLENLCSLRYLCLVNALPDLNLDVSTFSKLQELRVYSSESAKCPLMLSPNSFPTSLITLHLSGIDTSMEVEPAPSLQAFQNLQHLALGNCTPPAYAAAVLSQCQGLKSLMFGLYNPSDPLTALPDVEEDVVPLPALAQLSVSLWLGSNLDPRRPSPELLEDARRLFFDYRQSKTVQLYLTGLKVKWKSEAERAEFVDQLHKVWSAEGTDVSLKIDWQ